MTPQGLKWLREVVRDGLKRPDRLTPWEITFLQDMSARVDMARGTINLSEAQWEAAERIEKKVYRVG